MKWYLMSDLCSASTKPYKFRNEYNTDIWLMGAYKEGGDDNPRRIIASHFDQDQCEAIFWELLHKTDKAKRIGGTTGERLLEDQRQRIAREHERLARTTMPT